MKFTLKIWRQKDAKTKGAFETYTIDGISPDTSFLEMLDIFNDQQITSGKEPVAFDHDCREGICGMCSMHISCMRRVFSSAENLPLKLVSIVWFSIGL